VPHLSLFHLRTTGTIVLLAAAGCQVGSVCNPPGATSGQISNIESSAAYQSRLGENAAAPHQGCRAEATIPVAGQTVKDRPDIMPSAARPDDRPNPSGVHVDPRVRPAPADMGGYQGQIRVLGVGRGIDPDDCGKTAVKACNDAVEAYFAHERLVRPLGINCALQEGQELCQK
jgi:hypothetical protein